MKYELQNMPEDFAASRGKNSQQSLRVFQKSAVLYLQLHLLQSTHALSWKSRMILTLQKSNAFKSWKQCYSLKLGNNLVKGRICIWLQTTGHWGTDFPIQSQVKTSVQEAKIELWPTHVFRILFFPLPPTTLIRFLYFFILALLTSSNPQVIVFYARCNVLGLEMRETMKTVVHSQTVLSHQIHLILLCNSGSNYLCHQLSGRQ